jgi:hypothetical protein
MEFRRWVWQLLGWIGGEQNRLIPLTSELPVTGHPCQRTLFVRMGVRAIFARDPPAKSLTGCPDRQSNLCPGSFKQLRKTIDVRSARVADHEIAKSALTPCFHVERQFLRQERILVQAC